MDSMLLDSNQRKFLLKLARQTILNKFSDAEVIPVSSDPSLAKKSGTFVTLKIGKKLRGCIGNIEPVKSVYTGIKDNAINAAFNDHRFSSLTQDEFKKVHIGISILSAPQPLAYDDGDDLLQKLTPGVDGVIVRLGGAGATFLPQVWSQLQDPQLFLTQLCLKAGLPGTAWQDSQPEIQLYQVQSFEEEEL